MPAPHVWTALPYDHLNRVESSLFLIACNMERRTPCQIEEHKLLRDVHSAIVALRNHFDERFN